MIVTVDARSAVPPYEQLRSQVRELVLTGSLGAGSQLPPIRQLARDLGLAPGTVARAYAELERDGLVVARGRHGTVVADGSTAPPIVDRERRRLLDAAASSFAAEAKRLGVPPADALAAARRALQ
jgi:DNA-binding transcriptional regulator YhcF (GntR family)